MLLAKLNRAETPPSTKNLSKQQITNIMKSGPTTEVPPLPIAPVEKDYNAELKKHKELIQQ